MRRAVLGDARAIAEVHVRTWLGAYRGLVPDDFLDGLSVDEREGRWTELLGAPPEGFVVLVAEEDGRVVGFCSVLGDEVTALYVEPSEWGWGIGAALLEAGLDVLRESGFTRATLCVLVGNERALSFYGRFGFEEVGREIDPTLGAPLVRLAAPLTV